MLIQTDSPKFILKPVRHKLFSGLSSQLLARWQSNNSPSDLGVVRFGFDLFPHSLRREYGTARWVRPALYNVLRYKEGDTKVDRCHAICTYREGSKSTWFAKILPLYLMLVGEYGIYHEDALLPETDYIRLRAKTEEEAVKRLDNAIYELNFNQNLINIFGNLQPTIKEIRDKKLKSQAKFIMLLNDYVWQASGLNQPSRGANVRDKRPKVDIDDDVENKENTKTRPMRKYNSNEIIGEQFPGLDPEGITVYIGNYVHKECLIRHLLESPSWKHQFFTATYIDELGVERSDWAKRFSVDYYKKLERWYDSQPEIGGRKIYRLEYYNEVISDKDYRIIEEEGHYQYKDLHNWVYVKGFTPDLDRLYNAFVVVSVDPAISESEDSSDGAVTVTAFCSDRQRRILNCRVAKFDIRDRFERTYPLPLYEMARSEEDTKHLVRKGGVDEAVRMIMMYHADAYVVERAGQQLAWYNDIKDLLDKFNIHIPGLPYHPTDEKIYKLETGLLNLWAAGRYVIMKSCPNGFILKGYIQAFPDAKKDLLDCLYNAEKMGRPPDAIGYDTIGQLVIPEASDVYIPPEDVEAYILF